MRQGNDGRDMVGRREQFSFGRGPLQVLVYRRTSDARLHLPCQNEDNPCLMQKREEEEIMTDAIRNLSLYDSGAFAHRSS